MHITSRSAVTVNQAEYFDKNSSSNSRVLHIYGMWKAKLNLICTHWFNNVWENLIVCTELCHLVSLWIVDNNLANLIFCMCRGTLISSTNSVTRVRVLHDTTKVNVCDRHCTYSYRVTFTFVIMTQVSTLHVHKHGILAIVAPKKASQGCRYISKTRLSGRGRGTTCNPNIWDKRAIHQAEHIYATRMRDGKAREQNCLRFNEKH